MVALHSHMFGQLKSVYESEAEILRGVQERRMREAYQEHATSLQAEREKMEEAFRAREEELERGVRAKKKFLWGLARSLREQHEHLARAMAAVKYHTNRLREREANVKSQLSEVEHLMKTQGKEMEGQISQELLALEEQLDNVRMEREAVCREREELEHLKIEICTSRHDMQVNEIEASPVPTESDYNLLRNEIKALRAYIEIVQADRKGSTNDDRKISVNHNSVTETNGQDKNTELLNNEQDTRNVREDENRLKNNQVVNDFKKQKNVNFTTMNMDDPHMERRRSEGPQLQRLSDDTLNQLRQENERLKEYARQKEQEVYQLSSAAARLQSELVLARGEVPPPSHTRPAHSRPHPRADGSLAPQRATTDLAPRANAPNASFSSPPNGIVSSLAWRCGSARGARGARGAGGEDTTVCGGVPPPRVFLPGDHVPFIGLLHDRHCESKRLVNQWRASRRASPLRARRPASPPSPAPAAKWKPSTSASVAAAPLHDDNRLSPNENRNPMQQAEIFTLDSSLGATACSREGSGAGEGQGEGEGPHSAPPPARPRARAPSPSAVLREAKERLRASPKTKSTSPLPAASAREKSPSTVLREAKLRLRKLEIEAEAVERSYHRYRRRQSEMRGEREGKEGTEGDAVTKDIGDLAKTFRNPLQKHSHKSIKTTMGTKPKMMESQKMTKNDLAVLLREFKDRLNLNETQFSNRNTSAVKVKPIPEAFSPEWAENKDANIHGNYLETPLAEFRKNYRPNEAPTKQEALEEPQRPWTPTSTAPNEYTVDTTQMPAPEQYTDIEVKQLEEKKDAIIKEKNTKKQELEILKKNITRIYNILDEDKKAEQLELVTDDVDETNLTKERKETNLLRIEVENTNEVSAINVEPTEQENLLSNATSELEPEHPLSGNMTILISPKRSPLPPALPPAPPLPPAAPLPLPPAARCLSPEQQAQLTRNDVLEAIFHADPDKVNSNYEITDDTLSRDNETLSGGGGPDEYPDDFSADVDNYNHSQHTSPDTRLDPFWDDAQMYS